MRERSLQLFRRQFARQFSVAGEVPAGPVEAGDKAQCDRVATGAKDDGYGRGRCLRRPRCGGAGGYEYRYASADEIGCKRREPIGLIFRPALFDRHVLALDISRFPPGPGETGR